MFGPDLMSSENQGRYWLDSNMSSDLENFESFEVNSVFCIYLLS